MNFAKMASEYKKRYQKKESIEKKEKVVEYSNPLCFLSTPEGCVMGIKGLFSHFQDTGVFEKNNKIYKRKNGGYAVLVRQPVPHSILIQGESANRYVEEIYFVERKEEAEALLQEPYKEGKDQYIFLSYMTDRGKPFGTVSILYPGGK